MGTDRATPASYRTDGQDTDRGDDMTDLHSPETSRRWFLRAGGAVGVGAAAFGSGIVPAAAADGQGHQGAEEAPEALRTPGTRPAVRTGTGLDRLPHPLVVAHRGASGYRPEHTIGSYEHALDLGADVIEQDLVPTKDGHLVVRHENEIGGTTDVADHKEFAARRTTKTIDGKAVTGWFTEDFTLAELRTLRAKERLPLQRQHNTLYDGRWAIPTFREVAEFAARRARTTGREVWLYPETKHPSLLPLHRPAARGAPRRRAPARRAGRPATGGPSCSPSSRAASSAWPSWSTTRASSCSATPAPSPTTSSWPRTRAPSPTWSPRPACAGSPATPTASARPPT
ncbi:hypothetical protein GCM10020229_60180 [Kitasatospora albolonga]